MSRFRPTRDEYFSAMALLVSQRATCRRRKVGCVLVNDYNHVIATGYNGVSTGFIHCVEVPCSGAEARSGTGLDLCEASHAEQNALLQCTDVQKIARAYVTASPCITCMKLLLNTSCQTLVYIDEYPHARAKEMWLEAGRTLVQVPKPTWLFEGLCGNS